jgi:hypothetical protein
MTVTQLRIHLAAIVVATSPSQREAAIARLVRALGMEEPGAADADAGRGPDGKFRPSNRAAVRRRGSKLLERFFSQPSAAEEEPPPTTEPKAATPGRPTCGRNFGMWKPGSRGF